MTDWELYTGDAAPHPVAMPPAPPWRRFDAGPADGTMPAGSTFRVTPDVVEAVNAALHLRRPLLLTGRPGSGKSSLIESVARELGLGEVLRWHVTSRSTVAEALYGYDAIGRMQARTIEDRIPPIGDFLALGPLGTALVPGDRPRALLIDEIDKSDIDLPNDLLAVFERGEFGIPELARLAESAVDVPVDDGGPPVTVHDGRIRCREFPFVVLTSNGERDFPAAFLRRCIRLRMPEPTVEMLTEIVVAHLGPESAERCADRIRTFAAATEQGRPIATDQLLNVVHLLAGDPAPGAEQRERVVDLLLKQLVSDPP